MFDLSPNVRSAPDPLEQRLFHDISRAAVEGAALDFTA